MVPAAIPTSFTQPNTVFIFNAPPAPVPEPSPPREPHPLPTPIQQDSPPEIQSTLHAVQTEDDLIRLNSLQIEAYIKALKTSGTLEPAFERRLKKARRFLPRCISCLICIRVIKNREYAQQSRNKKKQAIGEMETELKASQAESASLRARNAELEADNARLRAQVRFTVILAH